MSSRQQQLCVGLLLPCRDEAAVIARRLANLALLAWPPCPRPHRLIVVDDHSQDGTAQGARAALEGLAFANVEVRVVPNCVRPGKNGAIIEGLAQLAQGVDLVVLTDADVLVEPGALLATCAAFAGDEGLGMACGTQVFTAELAHDGRCTAPDGGAPRPVGEAWDHFTAAVRRLESRWGKLFSVHGQWLAWRADLDLCPRTGVAADDVDLMLQVRSGARGRVRMLPDARFYECKPRSSAAARAQGLRRARAWFQVFAKPSGAAGLRKWDRLQWWSYAHLPGLLPWLGLAAGLSAGLLAAWAFGLPGLALALVALSVLLAAPTGRAWLRTLRLIAEARHLERLGALPEAWEMSRE
jgi:cellulose synthase/poly-beta-1,6-N-acetylglucosamine synthase-like glycosyltransferase